jgi:peptidoglycan lytic transglycosylase G
MVRTAAGSPRFKIGIAIGLIGALMAAGAYLYLSWHRPLHVSDEIYEVKPGTSLRGLGRQLHERGILADPYTFIWLGYLTGRSRQLKAGEYRFRAGISAAELLDQVVTGRVVKYPLVIVEGWNFRQVMHAIESAPKLTLTLTGATPAEIMSQLGHPGLHPEGQFFPDTYYYSRGHTDAQILASAFDKMQTTLENEWKNRAADLPLNDMDEALTLASIIEKETARPEERPLIAGVFINRLRRHMRLQSDPTVIYGLGARFDGNIRLNDLRADTAYNTYTRGGLPPTPIAMPGLKSLDAALHPADTPALYFVSRGDGSHVFSATLEEHAAAVAKYQLGERPRNSGSTAESAGSNRSAVDRK